jgi:hypothetical protein
MNDGNQYKGRVKVKKNPVVLLVYQILFGKSLKTHQDAINGAAMKDQDKR